jgi:hypothetical protein
MGGHLRQGLYRVHEFINHVSMADMLTKGHLNYFGDPFDAHECECDDCDYGYCPPA